MNVRLANETLKVLKASGDSPVSRVASRWLFATMATDYDVLLRLQIMEGAAGVPVDSWWKKVRSPAMAQVMLGKARTHFNDKGDHLDPSWFATGVSSLFQVLSRNLNSVIHSFKLSIEPADIINNTLMGLPLDPSDLGAEDEQLQRAPYLAGKYLSSKIRSGNEKPEAVAAGPLTSMLKNKVQNLSRHRLEQMPETDKGGTKDISEKDMPQEWGAQEENTAGDYLTSVFFYDLNDPLGKEVRKFMRMVWSKDPNSARAKTMPYWLDRLESHQSTDYASVAKEFGFTAQSFKQNHWTPAWRDFFSALWANPGLMTKINQRLRDKNLETLNQTLPRDAINTVLPFRKEQWVTASVSRVASRYLNA